jgi:hypothetical protein
MPNTFARCAGSLRGPVRGPVRPTPFQYLSRSVIAVSYSTGILTDHTVSPLCETNTTFAGARRQPYRKLDDTRS